MLALSPDGRSVAYVGFGTSINLRVFVRPVTGGRGNPAHKRFRRGGRPTPNGRPTAGRILYLARGGAFSSPSSGGPARQELPAGQGSAVDLGRVVTGRRVARLRRSPTRSSCAMRTGRLRKLAAFLEPSLCAWSPDGRAIACASGQRAATLTAGVNFGNLSPSWIVVCRMPDATLTSVKQPAIAQPQPGVVAGRPLDLLRLRPGDGVRDVYAQQISSARVTRPALRRGSPPCSGAQSLSRFSPDGRRLAYVVYAGTGNIWSLAAAVQRHGVGLRGDAGSPGVRRSSRA